jgi:cytochrome c2
VPGTAMAFPGISDSTRRAAIIAYLRDPPGRR